MLKENDKTALLKFLKEWAKPMQEIFNQRFGARKIGHIIIAVDTGNEPTITFTTNLRDGDFKRCMKVLSDRVNESRIIH